MTESFEHLSNEFSEKSQEASEAMSAIESNLSVQLNKLLNEFIDTISYLKLEFSSALDTKNENLRNSVNQLDFKIVSVSKEILLSEYRQEIYNELKAQNESFAKSTNNLLRQSLT